MAELILKCVNPNNVMLQVLVAGDGENDVPLFEATVDEKGVHSPCQSSLILRVAQVTGCVRCSPMPLTPKRAERD